MGTPKRVKTESNERESARGVEVESKKAESLIRRKASEVRATALKERLLWLDKEICISKEKLKARRDDKSSNVQ